MRDATVLDGLETGLQRRTGSIENPNVPLQDVDAWNEAFGAGIESDSGISVSAKTAFYLPVVWQLSSMISGDLAKLPRNVYRRVDDEDREIDRLHPAFYLVRKRPNDEMTAFHFWRYLHYCSLIFGNGYAHIERNGRGEPSALWPLDPERVEIKRDGGRLWVVYETIREGKPFRKVLPYTDVLHIQGPSFDGSIGARMVYYARNMMGLALSRQKYASKFFKNGAKQSGFLHLNPGTTKENQENAQKAVEKFNADEKKWHSVGIVRDGHKFIPTSIDPRAGQLTEQGEAAVRELCRYFNVAPSRAGLSDSVSYNSKAEDNQSYLDTTLSPHLEGEASECNLKLLSGRQQKEDSHYFEHNTHALLKMNAVDQATVHGIYIQNGVFSPNVVLKQLNMKPFEGGDERKSVQAASPLGGGDKGGNSPPRGDGKGDSQLNRSERAKNVKATIELARVARHRAGKGHRAWGDFLNTTIKDFPLVPLRLELEEHGETWGSQEIVDRVERLCIEHESLILGE